MLFVSIIPTEEASLGVADRYNIVGYDTKEVLRYNVKKENLEEEIKKHCYTIKDGAQYLPLQSQIATIIKEGQYQDKYLTAVNVVNHPFSSVPVQIITGVMLMYIWMYGIGAIAYNLAPLFVDIIIICMILAILTALYVFSIRVVVRAKKFLRSYGYDN